MEYGKYKDVLTYAQSVLDAYDFAHTCRVLNYALQIVDDEKNINDSVVILAAILHDIGRTSGNAYCHASVGGERSKAYLVEHGYAEEVAEHVANCIRTHSSNSDAKPQTKEAKILFDADKLDKAGAVGSVRAVIDCKTNSEPLYALGENGLPMEGKKDEPASLLRTYRQNLRKLRKVFYTDKAKKMASKRQKAMDDYFKQFKEEVERNHKKGDKLIQKYCA